MNNGNGGRYSPGCVEEWVEEAGAASAYTRHQTGVRKPRQMIIHEAGSSGPGAVGVGLGARPGGLQEVVGYQRWELRQDQPEHSALPY